MARVVLDYKAENLEDAAFSCPVNAFRKSLKGEFVIHPDECIDCGVCQSIVEEGIIDETDNADEAIVKYNAENSELWEKVQ